MEPNKVDNIPFCVTSLGGLEEKYIKESIQAGAVAGDGPFTKKCHAWLKEFTGSNEILLTHSCTAALEMSALLADLVPGDEVIMPSYTFVSTANAFALRGAVPVFVDIREDTLNLDERLIEEAITPKTRAIVPVHYAGVGCEMDAINAIAERHNLVVIEDAAQGIDARYKGKHLGTIGHLGSFSFHQTKNISSGEGGALLVNDKKYVERAEIIREKGTNRSAFYRGQVDKYTWRDVGSSFLPSDILAAFLLGQFHALEKLQENRMLVWNTYREALGDASEKHGLRMPVIPEHCEHNAHMFYMLLPDGGRRDVFLSALRRQGIGAVFHYVPLHSAPKGVEVGRVHGSMQQTDDLSGRLVRLPLFSSMTMTQTEMVTDRVVKTAREIF